MSHERRPIRPISLVHGQGSGCWGWFKHSYGFRPGCGCKDALRRVEELLHAGHTHVVDVDIRGYFDAIPHDRLMSLVRERITGSHFDFLGYRFKRNRRGRLMRLVRPKSLRKLRETSKPRTRWNNGKSMEAIATDLNRTLKGWYGYFKHAKASELGGIDGWVRMSP